MPPTSRQSGFARARVDSIVPGMSAPASGRMGVDEYLEMHDIRPSFERLVTRIGLLAPGQGTMARVADGRVVVSVLVTDENQAEPTHRALRHVRNYIDQLNPAVGKRLAVEMTRT